MGDIVSGFAGMKAGKQKAYEYELQSKQQEVQAIAEEGDRKYRLLEALASQNAMAGAKNLVAFEGSPMSITQQDIATEEVATERSQFGLKLAQRMNRMRGKSAKMAGYYGLVSGVMKTGGKVASGMSSWGGGDPGDAGA